MSSSNHTTSLTFLAYGPMAVFPNAVLSWKVMDFLQVNERALSIFTIIEPKPDIVIIGYGDRPNTAIRKPRIDYDIDDEREEKMENEYRLVEKRNKEVAVHCAKLALTMRQKKINLECMPTEDACAAYNYLVSGKLKLYLGVVSKHILLTD